MKQSTQVSPKGIVRNAPATLAQPSHADAIVNLRPQGGGWQTVGAKQSCYNGHTDGGILLRVAIHQLVSEPQMVAVRQLADGSFQIAAAPLEAENPVWQTLVTLPNDTSLADAMKIHIAFVGNFCCLSTPALRIFRFNGSLYVEESTAVDSAPTLNYSVQGRYTSAGALLSFSVPVTGENLEGCYYRELATGQYSDELLNESAANSVVLNQGTGNTPKQWGNLVFGEGEKQTLLDAMAGQYETLQAASDYYREGYVLVCSAWQLADGSFTCPSEPVLLHLGCENVVADLSEQLGETFDPTTDIDVYFNRDKICFRQFAANGISATTATTASFSCQVRRQWVQQLTFAKPAVPQPGSDLFRKAVFFVSPPVSMYQLAKADFDYLHTIYHYGLDATTKGLVEGDAAYYRLALKHASTHHEGLTEYLPTATDVSGWILYKAVVFDLTDPEEAASKRVDFSTLTTNEVLEAELAGHLSLSCAGLLAYNQRLHLYNCSSTLKGTPVLQTTLNDVPAGFIYRYVETRINSFVTERHVVPNTAGVPFVRPVGQKGQTGRVVAQFRLANGNNYLYHYRTLGYQQVFSDAGGNQWLSFPRFLSFPDSRCDQCTLFYQLLTGDDWRSVTFAMHPSGGFNFSFALHLATNDNLTSSVGAYVNLSGGTPISAENVDLLFLADGKTFGQPLVGLTQLPTEGVLRQPDVLMVSKPANPYVYPSELAFHYGATVTAAEVSMREISSAQTGQYPLAVFTDGGIWGMELGTTAFYSRQVPISAEVNSGSRVLGTPFGIVFLSAGGVKLLQGRQVTRLDAEASGPVSTPLWQSASLADVVANKTGQLSAAAALADQHLSAPNGMAYWLASGVELGYDAAHHELLLSSAALALPLTYVYSFADKQWFSIGETFYAFAGVLGVQRSGSGSALCRLGVENADGFRPVALVSRPFAMVHFGYRHLNRLLLHGNLQGGGTTYSGLYVMASNNLADWRMVSAVQWKHDLTPQVRLPRSKCSWRFYAYAFFADVPGGFWLSDVEVSTNSNPL